MLDQIRPGDIFVVWKLDRLARSIRDLLNTMDTINEAGWIFLSVSEPWADTTTHTGKMIMTIFAGIAEFERDLIRERTGGGREAAKQRGVPFGKLNTDQAQAATQWFAEGKPVRDIAKTFNVHEAASIASPLVPVNSDNVGLYDHLHASLAGYSDKRGSWTKVPSHRPFSAGDDCLERRRTAPSKRTTVRFDGSN